jgi:chitinase
VLSIHPGPNVKRDAETQVVAALPIFSTVTTTTAGVASAADPTAASSSTAAFLPIPTVTSQNIDSDSDAPLVMAYYPDWAGSSFQPENIDFGRFDWIDFAFALPDQNFNITWDDPTAPLLLQRLVSSAHAKGKNAKLSIGGWTGSQ